MSLTVHSISGSPMGWRVLLGLAFKRLEYRVIYLQGAEKEHRQPAFLQMNPHGKVPVLTHEGVHHRESLAILGWLDMTFPDHPLFGETPREMQTIWTAATGWSDYFLQATNAVVFPVFRGADGAPRTEPGETSPEEAARLLKVELDALEQQLQNRPFVCADTPTAADAVAYPEIGRLMRARQTRPRSMERLGLGDFDHLYPNIARWRDEIAALPGYDRTVPPHWAASD